MNFVNSFKEEGLEVTFTPNSLKNLVSNFDPKNPHKNLLWTTDPSIELPIIKKKSGEGSNEAMTLIDLWKTSLESFKDRKALAHKMNPKAEWKYMTYQEFYEVNKLFASAMIQRGITERTGVAILGGNHPAWLISYHGAIFANCIPCGIYFTSEPDACQYILEQSDAEIIMVDENKQLDKILQILHNCPKLKYIIHWGADFKPDTVPRKYREMVISFDNFIKPNLGHQLEHRLNERMQKSAPGLCMTYVFTSGTTGNPKGVMLSHDNYMFLTNLVDELELLKNDTEHRIVSFLPLSHVAAQYADIILTQKTGATIYFADENALRGTLIDYLLDVKPTIFFGVPRVWEKIEDGVRKEFVNKPWITSWARSVSDKGMHAEMTNKSTSWSHKQSKLIVIRSIKKKLGLQYCEHFLSGAAPMPDSTKKFFFSIGIFINNVYGMSETSGPILGTQPKHYENYNLKSCGQPSAGMNVKLMNEDAEGNGEICFRSRSCFMGYLKNEEATLEAIDKKRFVHSGDIGKYDALGNIVITGRIKEIIVTAGGENVAPLIIESNVKSKLPFISQVMVIGDRRKFLIAILSMKTSGAPNDLPVYTLGDDCEEYQKKYGINDITTVKEAIESALIRKIVDDGIEAANKKAVSKAAWIKKWIFVSDEFTVPGGELTPTQKLKRKIISMKYRSEIEECYLNDPNL